MWKFWRRNSKVIKLQEEKLQEEILQANRLIGQYFHEVIKPLQSIEVHVDSLKSRRLNNKVKAKIDQIEHNLIHIFSLTEATIKIYNKGIKFDQLVSDSPQLINANSLIQTAILMLKNRETEKRVVIKVDYGAKSYIHTHESNFLQVIHNLLQNAYESIHESGQILVKTRINKFDLKNKAFQITIKDSGQGIPENHMDNIFLKGFSTKFKEDFGRGFGMYIVKKIADSSGWTISISSSTNYSNSGTEITILIPITKSM